jgi:Ca2+-binding RTX toxin-like protein
MRRLTRGRSLILVTLLLAGTLTLAATASNTVPQTYAAAQAQGIDTGDLAPAECGGLPLGSVVSGTGDLAGTGGNDLLLGDSSDQWLFGDDGDDCLAGGAGTDLIEGGPGTDVCIGSALAAFIDCESFFVY